MHGIDPQTHCTTSTHTGCVEQQCIYSSSAAQPNPMYMGREPWHVPPIPRKLQESYTMNLVLSLQVYTFFSLKEAP